MRCSRSMVNAVAALFVGAIVAVVAPPSAAVGAPPGAARCQSPPQAGPMLREVPWAQRWLGPEKAWKFSTGAGITVAVIDSGVMAGAAHLPAGKVLPGRNYLAGGGSGDFDCVGHGTGVASIIAGSPVNGVGFKGIAPGAKILPIRISEQQIDEEGKTSGQTVAPQIVADAIRWAVAQKARVINMSFILPREDPYIRDAVKEAIAANVVVVASAGNLHNKESSSTRPDPPVYPAAYPGVIGVGAIDQNGIRVTESQVGQYVDLMAPGARVICSAAGGGHQVGNGTSFAAPFVSGTVALMLAQDPSLTPSEVALRLFATASSSQGGDYSIAHGHGVVDPYRALTEKRVSGKPAKLDNLTPPKTSKEEQARAAKEARTKWWALGLAAAGAAIAGVVLAAAAILPRGRQRRWFPGRPKPFAARPDVEEPAEAFFTPPTPPVPSGTQKPR